MVIDEDENDCYEIELEYAGYYLEDMYLKLKSATLKGEKMVLTKKVKEEIKSLLDDYEKKGSPRLSVVIPKIKRDLDRKEILKRFNIITEEEKDGL